MRGTRVLSLLNQLNHARRPDDLAEKDEGSLEGENYTGNNLDGITLRFRHSLPSRTSSPDDCGASLWLFI